MEINKERILKENIEYKLYTFKREINPDLFYSSLETLISLISFKKNEAEKFISKLSSIYRYILDNKKKELVDLRDELNNLKNLSYLLNLRYDNNIILKISIKDEFLRDKLIPCTLQIFLEHAASSNIVSSLQPLKINCYIEDSEFLAFTNSASPRINITTDNSILETVNKSYSYFTDKQIENIELKKENKIKVPLIKVDEIESIE